MDVSNFLEGWRRPVWQPENVATEILAGSSLWMGASAKTSEQAEYFRITNFLDPSVFVYNHGTENLVHSNSKLESLLGKTDGGFDLTMLEKIVYCEDADLVRDLRTRILERATKEGEGADVLVSYMYYRVRLDDNTLHWVSHTDAFFRNHNPESSLIQAGVIYVYPELFSLPEVIAYVKTGDVVREMRPRRKFVSAISRLTEREKEVLQLVASGYRSRQISEMLQLSLQTVKCHRSNVLKKLNVKTSLMAVKILETEGL